MKLEGCNVSDLTAARPKVDYETDIGVSRLLEGERDGRKKNKRGRGNLSVDRGRDVAG